MLAVSSSEASQNMLKANVSKGLLNVLANVGHAESQKNACNTLQYLVSKFEHLAEAIKSTMGKNFYDLLEVNFVNLEQAGHIL
jgi:hypothetical protein